MALPRQQLAASAGEEKRTMHGMSLMRLLRELHPTIAEAADFRSERTDRALADVADAPAPDGFAPEGQVADAPGPGDDGKRIREQVKAQLERAQVAYDEDKGIAQQQRLPIDALPPVPEPPPPQHDWKTRYEVLWSQIEEDAYDVDALRPEIVESLNPAWLRQANLLTAFTHREDVFPRGVNNAVTSKMIHPIGAIAQCELRIDAPGYTGMLAPGSVSRGFFRVSNGNSTGGEGFVPGVSLKFPRTNAFAADQLFGTQMPEDGQAAQSILDESDFWKKPQQTWLGAVPIDAYFRELRTLFWLFNKARENPELSGGGCPAFSGLALSIDPLAEMTQDGDRPDGERRAPAGLQLLPVDHEALEAAYKAALRAGPGGFRGAFLRMDPARCAFDVVAREGPKGEERFTRIGALKVVSPFVASPFGDRKLFFNHSRPCPHLDVLPF
jgi:hypothetical protein